MGWGDETEKKIKFDFLFFLQLTESTNGTTTVEVNSRFLVASLTLQAAQIKKVNAIYQHILHVRLRQGLDPSIRLFSSFPQSHPTYYFIIIIMRGETVRSHVFYPLILIQIITTSSIHHHQVSCSTDMLSHIHSKKKKTKKIDSNKSKNKIRCPRSG